MARNRWLIEPGRRAWNTLAPADPLNTLKTIPSFTIKENPTQVNEEERKPITQVVNVNGKEIDVFPCAPPGQAMPTNPKMTFRFEHLRAEDYYRLKTLDRYNADFYMTTLNYAPSAGAPSQGRRMRVRILSLSTEWAGYRFEEQVYTITITVRLLPDLVTGQPG